MNKNRIVTIWGISYLDHDNHRQWINHNPFTGKWMRAYTVATRILARLQKHIYLGYAIVEPGYIVERIKDNETI